jgi:hypothetical protein
MQVIESDCKNPVKRKLEDEADKTQHRYKQVRKEKKSSRMLEARG